MCEASEMFHPARMPGPFSPCVCLLDIDGFFAVVISLEGGVAEFLFGYICRRINHYGPNVCSAQLTDADGKDTLFLYDREDVVFEDMNVCRWIGLED